MAYSKQNGYFIMLRYSSGYMDAVISGESGESDDIALFASNQDAQKWIDNSAAVQSGQVIAEIYEAPKL